MTQDQDEKPLPTVEEVQQFSKDQLLHLLKEFKIIERDEEDILREAGYKASHFLKWENDSKYLDHVGKVGKITVDDILGFRKRILGDSSPVRESTKKRCKPRKFGRPVVSGFKYSKGSVLPPECDSGSLYEPATEFKSLTWGGQERNWDDFIWSFMDRARKFLIGCANRRWNGTIYFGVNDQKEGGTHGEVVGIELSNNERDNLAEEMIRYITGEEALFFKGVLQDEKDRLREIIHPLRFVPIDSDSNLVVVEIDIEPKDSLCNYETFCCHEIPKENLKDIKERAVMNKKLPKISFLREQRKTQKIEGDRNLKMLGDKIKNTFAKERRDAEKERYSGQDRQDKKVASLLLRERSAKRIPDDYISFILVNNTSHKLEKHLSWIKEINWLLMIDVQSSNQNPVEKLLKANSEEDGSTKYVFEDTRNLSKRSTKEKVLMHLRNFFTPCFFTNCATEGWQQNHLNPLSEILREGLKQEISDSMQECMVIVLLDSGSNLVSLTKIIDVLAGRVKQHEFVVFSDNQDVIYKMEEIMDESQTLGPRSSQFMLKIDFETLKQYIMPLTGKENFEGLTIPLGINKNVKVSKAWLKKYDNWGLEILPMNKCEDVFVAKDEGKNRKENNSCFHEKVKDMNESIMRFLKGDSLVPWEAFYAKDNPEKFRGKQSALSALVERTDLGNIQEAIRQVRHRETHHDTGGYVKILTVEHQPGSGGTTLARNVLWEFRKDMLSVYYDIQRNKNDDNTNCYELIQNLATQLLELRISFLNYEDLAKLSKVERMPNILIGLDNSTSEIAFVLLQELQKGLEDSTNAKSCFIILSVQRDVSLKQKENRKDVIIRLQNELQKDEKEKFKSVYEKITKKKTQRIQEMVLFVILFQDVEKKSEYVARVVQFGLQEMLYKHELKLLRMLSLFKHFSNQNLPLLSCFKVAFPSRELHDHLNVLNENQGWSRFSAQTKLFAKKISKHFMGLKHEIIAEEIWKFTKGDQSIEEILLEVLDHSIFSCDDDRQEQLHRALKDLLVTRKTKIEGGKHNFSSLIHAVIDENERDGDANAKKVLEKGYDVICKKFKSHVALTLARFCYLPPEGYLRQFNESDFEQALKWANTASRHDENHFATQKVIGTIHEWKLSSVVKTFQSKQSYSATEIGESLCLAKRALNAFTSAQDLFRRLFTDRRFTDVTSDEIELPSIIPILMARVRTCLQIITIILGTDEIKKCPNHFKRIIQGEENEELHTLFMWVDLPWSWDEYGRTIRDSFQIAETCLREAMTTLSYTSVSDSWFQNHKKSIDKQLKTFCELFDNTNISRGGAQNFAWLIRSEQHFNHRSTSNTLCSLNKVFSDLYTKGKTLEREDNVLSDIRKMIEDEHESPEPYLFFIMMHFPGTNNGGSPEVKNLLKQSMKKLKELEKTHANYSILPNGKVVRNSYDPWFYLKEGDGLERLSAIKLQQGEVLELPNACLVEGEVEKGQFGVRFSPQDHELFKIPLRKGATAAANTKNMAIIFTITGPEAIHDQSKEQLLMVANEG